MGRRRALLYLKRLMATNPKPSPSSSSIQSMVRSNLSKTSSSSYSSLARFLSTNPAAEVYEGYDCNFVSSEQQQQSPRDREEEEEAVRYIPVKAYILSTSIDLKSMQADNIGNVIPPSSRSTKYVALRYSEYPQEISAIGLKENRDTSCYVVLFQYGSAVLFNIADHEAEKYSDIVRMHTSGLLPEMRKDDYAVVEKPMLMTWMQGGADFIVLQYLDVDGIRIIGSVLGQSIALDHYIRQVGDMIFTDINRGMEKTGTFTMQRKKLFQLVGKANSNLADLII